MFYTNPRAYSYLPAGNNGMDKNLGALCFTQIKLLIQEVLMPTKFPVQYIIHYTCSGNFKSPLIIFGS